MDKLDLGGLLVDFVAESREMLDALSGEIVAWERAPDDRERLDTIFRFVHTVKCNCGLFDFPRLQALSHVAEDVLADVRAGRRKADTKLVTAVLSVLDTISDMIDAIDENGSLPHGDDAALIAALQEGGEEAVMAVPAPATTESEDTITRKSSAQSSIRLPVELLDRMMNGVSNIVLARNELASHLRDVSDLAGAGSPFSRLSATIADVSEIMTRSRMQPIDGLFATLPRLVRDVSTQLGKQVNLEIDGGDAELDREMIEAIRDPLYHILRNAIDHGIERPEDRIIAGKSITGTLTISARQSGNQIMLHIVDDGKGINAEALVEKALAAGLVTSAAADGLSHQEKLRLACLPGLSTAASVTAISGRGVGMDVVRANVERIGGTIDLDSAVGAGTRITLRIPLTLTITPILMVGIRDQQFAIPRSYIEEVVQSGSAGVELKQIGNAWVLKHRGQYVPCLSLPKLMKIEEDHRAKDSKLLILRPSTGDFMALAVERLGEHLELAVRPVSPAIMGTGLYAGAAMTDEGSPILLLDVAGLARAGGVTLDRLDGLHVSGQENAESVIDDVPDVLLFDDLQGRRRAIRLAAVQRIDEVDTSALLLGETRARVVLDGEILPLAGVIALPQTATIQLARLSDGNTNIAYALGEIQDIKPMTEAVIPEPVRGEVEGVTLIEGAPVEIIDTQWLTTRIGGGAAGKPVCSLPKGDAWVGTFLQPIVEAAGYRIATQGEEADVAITFGDPDETALRATNLIRLGEEGQVSDSPSSVINRNDRDGLMAALLAASSGARR